MDASREKCSCVSVFCFVGCSGFVFVFGLGLLLPADRKWARFLGGASGSSESKVRLRDLFTGDRAGEEDNPEGGEEGTGARGREPYVFVTLEDMVRGSNEDILMPGKQRQHTRRGHLTVLNADGESIWSLYGS